MVLVSTGPAEQLPPAKTRIIGHTRPRAKTSPPRAGPSSRSLFASRFTDGEDGDERPFSPPSGWDPPPSRADLSRDVSKGRLIRGSSQGASRHNLGLEVEPPESTEAEEAAPESSPEPSPERETSPQRESSPQAPWSEPWASRGMTSRQASSSSSGGGTSGASGSVTGSVGGGGGAAASLTLTPSHTPTCLIGSASRRRSAMRHLS